MAVNFKPVGSFNPQAVSTPSSSRIFSDFRDVRETGGDLKEAFLNAGERLNQAGEAAFATATDKNRSLPERIVGTGSQVFRGIGRFIGGGIVDLAKTAVTQNTEEAIASKVQQFGQNIGQSRFAQDLMGRYQALDPKTKEQVDNILGYAEGVAEIGTAGIAPRFLKPIASAAGTSASAAARGTGVAFKSVADRGLGNVGKTAGIVLPKLLSYTSDVPEQAFKTLLERREPVVQAIKAGTTPEVALRETQSAVRQLRKSLSNEWDESIAKIANEFADQRMGLNDRSAKHLTALADEFGFEIPDNLKSASAFEWINTLKSINELPKLTLTVSPKGAAVRKLKDALKENVIKNFGGEQGSVAQLYKNYAAKKAVFDAANDIVKAYSSGKPIQQATAQNRLQTLFNENKSAYLDAILDLERVTGVDILSKIAASKFNPKLPSTGTAVSATSGILAPKGFADKAISFLALPLTSPRSAGFIARWLARSPKSAVEVPKAQGAATPKTAQGQAFAGAIGGVETDEEGNLSFNPVNAVLGAAGMAGAQRGAKWLGTRSSKPSTGTSISTGNAPTGKEAVYGRKTDTSAPFEPLNVSEPVKTSIKLYKAHAVTGQNDFSGFKALSAFRRYVLDADTPETKALAQASADALRNSGAKFLYRGGKADGFSWTTDENVAKRFGKVTKIEITPEVLNRVVYSDLISDKLLGGKPYKEAEVILRPASPTFKQDPKTGRMQGSEKAIPQKSPAQSMKAIRYTKEGFENSDAVRGGTWYATPESKDIYGGFKNTIIGGEKKIETTLDIKNPVKIETDEFEAGYSVISAGYDDLLPAKYRRAAVTLDRKLQRLNERDEEYGVEDYDHKVEDILSQALKSADIPNEQVIRIFDSPDKLNAAVDAIVSKGLRENGYDALILTDGETTHILKFP